MKGIFYLFILMTFTFSSQAQTSGIETTDISFESETSDWADAEVHSTNILDEQSGDLNGETKNALSGKNYLGLVTKDDNVHESVTQKLNIPLEVGYCYEFSVYLAKAVTYSSNIKIEDDKDYNNGVVLRVWGGPNSNEKGEKLAESKIINHSNWLQYKFELKPSTKAHSIILEAHFKTPILMPNGGNILIDNFSEVSSIDCRVVEPVIDEDIVAVDTKANVVQSKEIKKKTRRIVKESKYKNIRNGRTINIDKLTFAADAFVIKQESYETLDEIYEFLIQNDDLVVELAGHTNNVPTHKTCNKLSAERAKSVANYLITKGISKHRVKHKGYGKFKPKYSNNTSQGRKGNQRVEIKVIRIKG